MSSPCPSPIEENHMTEFEAISDKNNKFKITLKNNIDSLLISCQMNDLLINYLCEKSFSLQQMKENK